SIPARWSDGQTITAHDFVYSWRRAVDPKTAASLADYLSPLRNAAAILAGKRPPYDLGVEAPDDFTLRLQLDTPAPYLLQLLRHTIYYPVPSHVVEKARAEGRETQWTRPGTIVSNGPFVLAEWRPYDFIKVRKNPNYYQAALVRLEEIV